MEDSTSGVANLWRAIQLLSALPEKMLITGGVFFVRRVGFYVDTKSGKPTFSFMGAAELSVAGESLHYADRNRRTQRFDMPRTACLTGHYLDGISVGKAVTYHDLTIRFSIAAGALQLEILCGELHKTSNESSRSADSAKVVVVSKVLLA